MDAHGLLAMASRGTGVMNIINGDGKHAMPTAWCPRTGSALASRALDCNARTLESLCVRLLHEPCSHALACLACSMCLSHALESNIPTPHALRRPYWRLITFVLLFQIRNFYSDSDTNAFSGRYTSVHMLYC